jgi:hypothetical protein
MTATNQTGCELRETIELLIAGRTPEVALQALHTVAVAFCATNSSGFECGETTLLRRVLGEIYANIYT